MIDKDRILEENLLALGVQEGFDLVKIEALLSTEREQNAEEDCVFSAFAKDGNKILLYRKDAKEYRLNSAYRPEKEAEKWAKQFSVQNISACIILFGLGNGMFLRELLKRCPADTRILAVEPKLEIFLEALREHPVGDLLQDPRVSLTVLEAGGLPFYRLLDLYVTKENERDLQIIVHPQYEELCPGEYALVRKEMEDLKGRLTAASNTRKAFGRRIVRNTRYAIRRYAEDQGAFLAEDYHPDKLERAKKENLPVILIATGPSLAKSVEMLKKLQGKVLLFAADSALRYLLAKGICPDYIVTIDPLKWPDHFKREETRALPVFCRFDSNFRILEAQKGELIFFGGTQYPEILLTQTGRNEISFLPDTGGSVATAAFSLCRMLGFRKLVLVGQDLCYHGEKTHVGNVVSPDEKKQGFGKVWVPGNKEERVLTRQDWYRYLKWFENEISLHPELTVWNATEGGVRIRGAIYRSLEEIFEELPDVDRMKDCPDEGNEKPLSEQTGRSLGKEPLKMYLREEKKLLSALRKNFQVAGQLADFPSGSRENEQIMEFLSELEQMPVYYLLDLLLPDETTEEMYEMTGDPVRDEYHTRMQMKKFFKALEEAADTLLEME